MKKLLLLAIATMALANQAHSQAYVFSKQIGCGTITSVRNVNQDPIYSDDSLAYRSEYRPVTKSRTESSSTFGQFYGGGLIGLGTAVVGGILYDAVANSNNDVVATPNPGERYGKKMHAVQIALDDGRVLNLPLIEPRQPTFFGHDYEVGRRVFVAYSEQYRNIQIGYPQGTQPPSKDDSSYEKTCDFRGDKELADWIVKRGEFKVDESKIVE